MFCMFLPVQKKIRTRMLNSLLILEKMHPDGTNVFAFNAIDKYENRPDNLHSICRLSVDFASIYVTKNTDDLPTEPDEIKSTLFMPHFNLKLYIIVSKNAIQCNAEI